ncbi:hypothetical protein ABPG72_003113 [Tetrahymena utriculariae]
MEDKFSQKEKQIYFQIKSYLSNKLDKQDKDQFTFNDQDSKSLQFQAFRIKDADMQTYYNFLSELQQIPKSKYFFKPISNFELDIQQEKYIVLQYDLSQQIEFYQQDKNIIENEDIVNNHIDDCMNEFSKIEKCENIKINSSEEQTQQQKPQRFFLKLVPNIVKKNRVNSCQEQIIQMLNIIKIYLNKNFDNFEIEYEFIKKLIDDNNLLKNINSIRTYFNIMKQLKKKKNQDLKPDLVFINPHYAIYIQQFQVESQIKQQNLIVIKLSECTQQDNQKDIQELQFIYKNFIANINNLKVGDFLYKIPLKMYRNQDEIIINLLKQYKEYLECKKSLICLQWQYGLKKNTFLIQQNIKQQSQICCECDRRFRESEILKQGYQQIEQFLEEKFQNFKNEEQFLEKLIQTTETQQKQINLFQEYSQLVKEKIQESNYCIYKIQQDDQIIVYNTQDDNEQRQIKLFLLGEDDQTLRNLVERKNFSKNNFKNFEQIKEIIIENLILFNQNIDVQQFLEKMNQELEILTNHQIKFGVDKLQGQCQYSFYLGDEKIHNQQNLIDSVQTNHFQIKNQISGQKNSQVIDEVENRQSEMFEKCDRNTYFDNSRKMIWGISQNNIDKKENLKGDLNQPVENIDNLNINRDYDEVVNKFKNDDKGKNIQKVIMSNHQYKTLQEDPDSQVVDEVDNKQSELVEEYDRYTYCDKSRNIFKDISLNTIDKEESQKGDLNQLVQNPDNFHKSDTVMNEGSKRNNFDEGSKTFKVTPISQVVDEIDNKQSELVEEYDRYTYCNKSRNIFKDISLNTIDKQESQKGDLNQLVQNPDNFNKSDTVTNQGSKRNNFDEGSKTFQVTPINKNETENLNSLQVKKCDNFNNNSTINDMDTPTDLPADNQDINNDNFNKNYTQTYKVNQINYFYEGTNNRNQITQINNKYMTLQQIPEKIIKNINETENVNNLQVKNSDNCNSNRNANNMDTPTDLPTDYQNSYNSQQIQIEQSKNQHLTNISFEQNGQKQNDSSQNNKSQDEIQQTRLIFNDKKYSESEIQSEVKNIRQKQLSILKIEMGDQGYTDDNLSSIKQLLKYQTHLLYFSINLEDSEVTENGFNDLLQSLPLGLQILSIDISQIRDFTICSVFTRILESIQKLNKLVSLNLYMNQISDQSEDNTWIFIQENKSIKNLTIQLDNQSCQGKIMSRNVSNFLNKFKGVQKLTLSLVNHAMDDTQFENVINSIMHTESQIQSLILIFNNILTKTSLEKIKQNLQKMQKLNILRIIINQSNKVINDDDQLFEEQLVFENPNFKIFK